MKIYDVREKSFDEDLSITTTRKTRISVKTFRQHLGRPCKVSWVLGYADSSNKTSGKDSHFFGTDSSCRKDYLTVFVSLNPSETSGRVIAVMDMNDIYENMNDLYQDLKIAAFKNTKKAIYFDTMKEKFEGNLIQPEEIVSKIF